VLPGATPRRLVGVAFAVRALRSATVVEVAVGRTGMNGFGREYLVLHRRDGATATFKDLNAKPSVTHSTIVQEAARAINQALRDRRS
jgi:hypothetical protein